MRVVLQPEALARQGIIMEHQTLHDRDGTIEFELRRSWGRIHLQPGDDSARSGPNWYTAGGHGDRSRTALCRLREADFGTRCVDQFGR